MKTSEKNYRYALGLKWLAPLYDPFVKMVFNEEEFREYIIGKSNMKPNHKVIDLGCGTASLIIKIKQNYPETEVMGLDGDKEILGIARKKIDKLKLNITLEQGMIYQLPYSDNSFDRVLTTLALHHLKLPDKVMAIKEMFRILKPDGEIHIADFGNPGSKRNAFVEFFYKLHHNKTKGINGTIEQILKNTGFVSIKQLGNFKTIFGIINYHAASKSQ